MWRWTRDPMDAPDKPHTFEIHFEKGDPVAIDDQPMAPASILGKLNQIGSEHGVGRLDIVENRYVGMKSRGGMRPGGTILLKAHSAMESLTLIKRSHT